MENDFYIFESKNCISKDLCNALIYNFENNNMSLIPKTHIYDTIIYKILNNELNNYIKKINRNIPILTMNNISDSGYYINKITNNNYKKVYNHDFLIDKYKYRKISFILFLNDVKSGGENEFYNKNKINPEVGKLILYPSSWIYSFKEHPPLSNDKYILYGWFNCN